jgi:hypothetical protein
VLAVGAGLTKVNLTCSRGARKAWPRCARHGYGVQGMSGVCKASID